MSIVYSNAAVKRVFEIPENREENAMKQYVIDQLRETDYTQILEFLKSKAERVVLEDIFWINLPEGMYSEVQKEHKNCQPHYFAVNLTRNQVDFELLIRSQQIIRCNCICYADRKQRDYIIDFADGMLEELGIKL
jgi:hypothetical protein